ncbi:MAG: tetratricopeptide repeat protein, partial [candidate division NC10 bacterium]
MENPARLEQAEFFFQEGYRHQMNGDLDAAVEHYRRSIELYPTAEAHTFLGWAYSF